MTLGTEYHRSKRRPVPNGPGLDEYEGIEAFYYSDIGPRRPKSLWFSAQCMTQTNGYSPGELGENASFPSRPGQEIDQAEVAMFVPFAP